MSNFRILVAEDESTISRVIEFRLKKDGYEVITVDNGKAAIEKLKENMPDLLITDIMMPFYSGLEVTNAVRNECKSKIPIIVLSAAGLEHTVIEAFKLGADD